MARATMIIGLAKLDRKLERMPQVAKAKIKAAMEQGAEEIVQMMRSLAPEVSGALRDSIGWTWGKKPKYAQAMAVVSSALAGDLTITIYAGNTKVRYAHLVEFGAKAHVIVPKQSKALGKDGRFGVRVDHPGAKAQPFFWPAWRANRKKVRSRIRRATTAAAKEVAGSS